MTVKRWEPCKGMHTGEMGDFVAYEDFYKVYLAVRSVHASCTTFLKLDPNDATAAAVRDYLQKIIDQYE